MDGERWMDRSEWREIDMDEEKYIKRFGESLMDGERSMERVGWREID
jgi:hypothetical protein